MTKNTTSWENHPIINIMLLVAACIFAGKFVVFLSGSLAQHLSELNKGKIEYQYCGNCDALIFQCKYSEYKIPELEDDLCQISEYNGHYRKTTYQK